MQVEETVTITLSRLRELEAIEQKRKEAFDKLRQRDKDYPEGNTKRVLKHYNKNKDAINEKRREAYKLKKEAE